MSASNQQNSPSEAQADQVVVDTLQAAGCPPIEGDLNGGNSQSTLVLEGSLGIATIGELNRRLQPLLEQSRDIKLDTNALVSVDTAVLQLLVAFVRAARANGLDVYWESPSQNLRQTVALLGLERSLGLTG